MIRGNPGNEDQDNSRFPTQGQNRPRAISLDEIHHNLSTNTRTTTTPTRMTNDRMTQTYGMRILANPRHEDQDNSRSSSQGRNRPRTISPDESHHNLSTNTRTTTPRSRSLDDGMTEVLEISPPVQGFRSPYLNQSMQANVPSQPQNTQQSDDGPNGRHENPESHDSVPQDVPDIPESVDDPRYPDDTDRIPAPVRALPDTEPERALDVPRATTDAESGRIQPAEIPDPSTGTSGYYLQVGHTRYLLPNHRISRPIRLQPAPPGTISDTGEAIPPHHIHHNLSTNTTMTIRRTRMPNDRMTQMQGITAPPSTIGDTGEVTRTIVARSPPLSRRRRDTEVIPPHQIHHNLSTNTRMTRPRSISPDDWMTEEDERSTPVQSLFNELMRMMIRNPRTNRRSDESYRPHGSHEDPENHGTSPQHVRDVPESVDNPRHPAYADRASFATEPERALDVPRATTDAESGRIQPAEIPDPSTDTSGYYLQVCNTRYWLPNHRIVRPIQLSTAPPSTIGDTGEVTRTIDPRSPPLSRRRRDTDSPPTISDTGDVSPRRPPRRVSTEADPCVHCQEHFPIEDLPEHEANCIERSTINRFFFEEFDQRRTNN